MHGTLTQFPVTELVRELHARRDSGVLSLSNGATTKRVYFKDGDIVFASSSSAEERLGERLVREGKLDRSALELACRVIEASHLRIGRTLVEMGYVSQDELDRRVREQVEHIIRSVFPWQSGYFRKEIQKQPVDADLERSDIRTVELLLDGIRGTDDAAAIRKGVGDLQGSLRYASEEASLDSNLKLTAEEGYVLSRVDGVASAGEIAKVSPMGEDETLRCVYALVAANVLEVGPRPQPVPSPQKTEARPTPLSDEAARLRDELDEKNRRGNEVSLYELLDVSPDARPEAIKSAYFRLAKQLHPDHRVGLKLDDAEGLYDQMYLRIKAAYETLSDEHERRRYDFSLQRRMEAPRSQDETSERSTSQSQSRAFSDSQQARLHYTNGERYFEEARYHEAVQELRTAIRLDDRKADYHRLLARSLAKNPKWRKQAEEHYLRALQLNRFDVRSYLELGELYEAVGLSTRAKKMFDEAVALDPDRARSGDKLKQPGAASSAIHKLRGILHREKQR